MNKINKTLVILAIVGIVAFAFSTIMPKSTEVEQKLNIQHNINVDKTTNSLITESDDSGFGGKLGYESNVKVYKIEAATGKKILVADSHNLIVNNGLNYTRTQIGSGGAVASNSTKYMSLSNDGGAPQATDINIVSEITSNGLERAAATYAANGTGAWNFTYQWTATASQSAQKIGINYGASANDGTLFAELLFPAPQSLLVNDKLQAIWSQSIVSS